MANRITYKALFLLVVLLFHSLVLVPKAHATAFEGTLARIMFRSVAPSVITAMGSGTALVLGVPIAAGIGYIVYKSGAITALKNWWNQYIGSAFNPLQTDWWDSPGAGHIHLYFVNGYGWYAAGVTGDSCSGTFTYPPGSHTGGQTVFNSWGPYASAIAAYNAIMGSNPPTIPPPTVPTDYATALQSSQPDFDSTAAVYMSPGAAAALSSGAVASSAVTMSDSDADKFIAGLGGTAATAVTDTGTQAGVPSTNDNTVTSGDSAQIGLLQQIINFVSNLVGIKTAVEAQRTALDNVAAISQAQSGKLDNIAVLTQSQTAVLDNVGIAIQNQTAILDNVGADIRHMDNTLSGISSSTASVSTLQARVDALRDLAATKFPFSLVNSISASVPSGTSHYDFGSLPLTPAISIPIEPMAGPLSSLFTWIRQLLVWFFWAGTLLAMLRKAMEM